LRVGAIPADDCGRDVFDRKVVQVIHANRYIGMKDRAALEKLLAYGARGPFSSQRLSLLDPANPNGDLVYTLKTPWLDGTEAIQLAQHEAIEKLSLSPNSPSSHPAASFEIRIGLTEVKKVSSIRRNVGCKIIRHCLQLGI